MLAHTECYTRPNEVSMDPVRPFLKWAGGKFSLLGKILPHLPSGRRLIEPFSGSAVISLNAAYPTAVAADTNADLVDLYTAVQRDPERFVSSAKKLFSPENNSQETYNKLREEFNNSTDKFRKSTIFLYLNRHCFNGLCRYNSSGIFNVPFGKYEKIKFPEKAIYQFANKSKNIKFIMSDFANTMMMAQTGDVVYCDPPYVPLSSTSNFTAYAAGGFGPEKQMELTFLARNLSKRGIPVVISNHDTSETQQLYKDATIISFKAARRISCDGGSRAPVGELLAIYK